MKQRLPKEVKSGLVALMNQHSYIEGFAVGGSVAAGSYKPGDGVDVDLLLASYRHLPEDITLVRRDLARKFEILSSGLELHIIAPLAKDRFGITLERAFPVETIYLFKSETMGDKWHPNPNAEVYFADSC